MADSQNTFNQFDTELYQTVIKRTETGVFEWNRGNQYYISNDLQELFFCGNFDERLLEPEKIKEYIYNDDYDKILTLLASINNGCSDTAAVVRLRGAKVGFRWYKVTITNFFDSAGELQRVIGTVNDIDEFVKNQLELKYRVQFDVRTGIYNHSTFEQLSESLIKQNSDYNYAMIRMDVKRFKFINDLYGMEIGNKLLQKVASVITGCINSKSVCCRNNSDIFDICFAYRDENEIIDLIHNIVDLISIPEIKFKVAAFFGVCLVNNRTTPINLICDRTYLALKSIKGNALRNWAFYDEQLRRRQLEEQEIENEMEEALESGQFVIYLQSKHDITTGRIVGAESLVRWQHPQRGLISPNVFIPLFERNGFIIKLDEYVWEETCNILHSWLKKDIPVFPISVNLSRNHFYSSNFYDKLKLLVDVYGISTDLLELELTESAFVDNIDEIYNIMRQVQSYGFKFAMDDFGSGYSSLNMLKDAPINIVKFDRAFFSGGKAMSQRGQIIVKYMIEMSKHLGLQVIAEGVETCAQVDMLLDSGCAVAQGYYFSQPVPVEEFERQLLLNGAERSHCFDPARSPG